MVDLSPKWTRRRLMSCRFKSVRPETAGNKGHSHPTGRQRYVHLGLLERRKTTRADRVGHGDQRHFVNRWRFSSPTEELPAAQPEALNCLPEDGFDAPAAPLKPAVAHLKPVSQQPNSVPRAAG